MANRLSIVVVEKDRQLALMIVAGLREAGEFDREAVEFDVFVIGDDIGLARRIAERNPDLVLIDTGNPSRDVLEELTVATALRARPVAMFVDNSDAALTKAVDDIGRHASLDRDFGHGGGPVEMSATRLKLGFVPLVDAPPLIVAEALGFAAEAGLELSPTPARSWATLRDMLALGQVAAAQMLAPLPVASALGLGGSAARLGRVRQKWLPVLSPDSRKKRSESVWRFCHRQTDSRSADGAEHQRRWDRRVEGAGGTDAGARL